MVVGEMTGFAHTADTSGDAMREAARAAAAAARGGKGSVGDVSVDRKGSIPPLRAEIDPAGVDKAAKIELLGAADAAAREVGDAITQVTVRYSDSRRLVQVANTDGLCSYDDQVRTHFGISCVATGDAGMQTGRESVGHTYGFEMFDRYDTEELARTAAQRAITKLESKPAPSGTMPVVIGKGGGGVLFHEACGHGLEADAIAKNASVFANRVGEKVAADGVTLIDDGSMPGEWGNFAIDDEGHPAQSNVLIRDGVLVDYMWDMLRARKEGRPSSGNGRRESYAVLPMVRMTNTYLANGEEDPTDIIADTPSGVYVAQLGGGQVNPATGDFVFGMTEGLSNRRWQDHLPVARGQPNRQRSGGAHQNRPVGQRLRHGESRDVWQRRSRGPRRRRYPDASGRGPDGRRNRGMSGDDRGTELATEKTAELEKPGRKGRRASYAR